MNGPNESHDSDLREALRVHFECKQFADVITKAMRGFKNKSFITFLRPLLFIFTALCVMMAAQAPLFLMAKRSSHSGLIVIHQEYMHILENNKTRAWEPPKYEEQISPLGYSSDTFFVPEELKDNWQFWVDIYSKYSSNQGLLHDSIHPHLIYEVIDFSEIEQNPDLTKRQKILKRKEFVKERKTKVKEMILSLQNSNNQIQAKWSSEQKRLWKLFERIKNPKKYKLAATDQRLRFQLGQKDRFLYGIFYSGRYLEAIEDIFKKANLPLELTRLPFVESSFNILARSKVGASGIWQFMPRTGKEYMTVNKLVDERNDPIKATQASAKMLKLNYSRLKDWPLAVTAYNFGLYGVRRLVKRRGTSDLFEIIASKKRSRRFGFASANFYLSFLAALHVEKNADQYFNLANGKKPVWAERLDYDVVYLKSPISFLHLTSYFENDKTLAFLYNPHLNKNIQKGYAHIPKGTKLYLKKGNEQAFVEEAPKEALNIRYKVVRRDTLLKIARKFNVSLQDIMRINRISNPNRLRAGQILSIPSPFQKNIKYKVVRGDTLLKIAGKFDVSFQDVIRANRISNPNRLKAGQMLLIPEK